MPSSVERLHTEVEAIARSDSPNLTFTTISPDGQPHSAIVWFAPTNTLDLLTFSSPTRIHAKHIDSNEAAGRPARVSGGMRLEGQRKSHADQHGVTFEGTAFRLRDSASIETALARFINYGTFSEAEIDKYLHHPTSEVPPHGVYVLRPTLWSIFDGRLGATNPERLVHLSWPSGTSQS